MQVGEVEIEQRTEKGNVQNNFSIQQEVAEV